MSIAVNKEQSSTIRGFSSCFSVYLEPSGTPNGLSQNSSNQDNNIVAPNNKGEGVLCYSSSSSSIGENSSSGNPSTLTSCNEDGPGDMEVQSSFKGPLDSLSSLEDSLPTKRGISKFFSGKSRSFSSLSDAASVNDLAKPDNPYNKKRRNLLAYANNWDRHRFCPPRNSSAGISKKAIHSSKSTLALAVAMSNTQNSTEDYRRDLQLPPLPPPQRQGKLKSTTSPPTSFSIRSLRSFSLTDLQSVDCQPNVSRF